MANVVIESVLAEEAQADLQIRAAKDKAAALAADAKTAAQRIKEEAEASAKALLAGCAEEAKRLAAEAGEKNKEEIRQQESALRERAAEKMDLAAEAVLFLLKRGDEE